MKKHLLGILVLAAGLFTASSANAQVASLERTVYASAGEYLAPQGAPLTLSCTIGEPIVETLYSVKLILTQGFQQPLENDIVNSVDIETADWSIKAFPNPFNDNVSVEISSDKSSEFTIMITNLIGQNLGQEYLANTFPGKNVYQLNTASLATGMYVVTVASKDGKLVKSFKMTKVL